MHVLELQRQTEISYSTLHRLYHEKATRVDLNTVEQICRALDIQVGDLFEYVGESPAEARPDKPKSKKGGK